MTIFKYNTTVLSHALGIFGDILKTFVTNEEAQRNAFLVKAVVGKLSGRALSFTGLQLKLRN